MTNETEKRTRITGIEILGEEAMLHTEEGDVAISIVGSEYTAGVIADCLAAGTAVVELLRGVQAVIDYRFVASS